MIIPGLTMMWLRGVREEVDFSLEVTITMYGLQLFIQTVFLRGGNVYLLKKILIK